jgi:hypothetical protein
MKLRKMGWVSFSASHCADFWGLEVVIVDEEEVPFCIPEDFGQV